MKKKKNQFNMVIVGTGGQGLITLLQILAQGALIESLDLKTSELHGLSQRGGSVEVHIRMGKKINSPLVAEGKADLILALEMQEALNAAVFSGPNTFFLINRHLVPIPFQKPFSEKEIESSLNKISKKISFVPASEICQKELGKNVVAGVYLLSLASLEGLIPIKPASLLKAMKEVIPGKYLEINRKTFELAGQKHGKKKSFKKN
jgi:indolepyruvate ferredoxin oxidoreductase, beta subunit